MEVCQARVAGNSQLSQIVELDQVEFTVGFTPIQDIDDFYQRGFSGVLEEKARL